MLKIISLMLSLSCPSCGFANFEIEYLEFHKEAIRRNCVAFPVNAYFARLEPEIAGYCIPSFGILINEDRWATFGPYQKRELMFHELGHCVLGLNHSDGLMSPKMHRESELKENWKAWVDDLFKNCQLKP
jgi:hypothetical protein